MTAIRGDLASIALSDVLQMLCLTEQIGLLCIAGDEGATALGVAGAHGFGIAVARESFRQRVRRLSVVATTPSAAQLGAAFPAALTRCIECELLDLLLPSTADFEFVESNGSGMAMAEALFQVVPAMFDPRELALLDTMYRDELRASSIGTRGLQRRYEWVSQQGRIRFLESADPLTRLVAARLRPSRTVRELAREAWLHPAIVCRRLDSFAEDGAIAPADIGGFAPSAQGHGVEGGAPSSAPLLGSASVLSWTGPGRWAPSRQPGGRNARECLGSVRSALRDGPQRECEALTVLARFVDRLSAEEDAALRRRQREAALRSMPSAADGTFEARNEIDHASVRAAERSQWRSFLDSVQRGAPQIADESAPLIGTHDDGNQGLTQEPDSSAPARTQGGPRGVGNRARFQASPRADDARGSRSAGRSSRKSSLARVPPQQAKAIGGTPPRGRITYRDFLVQLHVLVAARGPVVLKWSNLLLAEVLGCSNGTLSRMPYRNDLAALRGDPPEELLRRLNTLLDRGWVGRSFDSRGEELDGDEFDPGAE